jgi:3-isopropylmalate dehydrogenase
MRLVLLPGDGIGPEIAAATRRVVETAAAREGLRLTVETHAIGFAALDTHGTTLPDAVVEAARAADGVILGPVSHNAYPPREKGGINPSGALRRALDLFANIRPARSRAGVPCPLGRPVDLVIYRENLEGFYADRSMHLGPGEFMPDPDMALAVRKITRAACRRIAEAAFSHAAARERAHVTAIHKANVLRVSDGLFLEETRAAATRHPGVGYAEMLVDAAAAHLVRDPERFDVIVTTNMFGDILSDQASELAGGLGLAASLNAGEHHAAAQAQHGSAPDIAGEDRANPSSLIGSAAMLLGWIARRRSDAAPARAAARIETALDAALAEPETRTRDLGGPLGTAAFATAVIDQMESAP